MPRPEPESAPLCKKPGIRYLGSTYVGAEVCFTLTRDRSKWVEIGYKFVRASGCPGGRTGRSYVEGSPEPLLDSARIRAPGFTATLHGARASGVLGEPDVCGSKSFAWTAQRVS